MSFLKKIIKKISSFQVLYLKLKKFKYRSMGILNGINQNKIFQTASTTKFDRHPDLFDVVSELYKDKTNYKILSYGCSKGEECLTLNQYFKNACIIGTDINKKSLKKARSKTFNPKIEYIFSEQNNIIEKGSYDIIFALSVLCKNPEAKYLEDISPIYSFQQYEETVLFFDKILKPGGILIIRSSNFLFKDTSISKNYLIFKHPKLRSPQLFPKFSSDNKRITGYLDDEEIFIKQI